MRKKSIPDTNVLLHDPRTLLSFQENQFLAPIKAISRFIPTSSDREQHLRWAGGLYRPTRGYPAAGGVQAARFSTRCQASEGRPSGRGLVCELLGNTKEGNNDA